MRHSGELVAFTLRRMTSNLSLWYLSCISCIAEVNHVGGHAFDGLGGAGNSVAGGGLLIGGGVEDVTAAAGGG